MILSDIYVCVNTVLCVMRSIQFIASWDVFGKFLFYTWVTIFEVAEVFLACIFLYMLIDVKWVKMEYTKLFQLCKKK